MSLALSEFLDWRKHGYADTRALGEGLQALVNEGLDQLPLPAGGQTLERWQALACVAGHDLGLCKLFEGHTDALAIMQELHADLPDSCSTWGMWAAEPPQARVNLRLQGEELRLYGRKAWCSGAAVVSHALMTVWDPQDRQQLVAVKLDQPGVTVTTEGWRAVGMGATGSVEVIFDNAQAVAIGDPGAYLARPGFWQGAIGIAACWQGAARGIAQRLLLHASRHDEPHALAHLGAVDIALHSASSVLHAAAVSLDSTPHDDAELLARRCRGVVEQSTEYIMMHVGRALGASPYCKDAHFARLIADLPVFLRQSHAERDLAVLGQLTAGSNGATPSRKWLL